MKRAAAAVVIIACASCAQENKAGSVEATICVLAESPTASGLKPGGSLSECADAFTLVSRAVRVDDHGSYWSLAIRVNEGDRSELSALLQRNQNRMVAYTKEDKIITFSRVTGTDATVLNLGFESEAEAYSALSQLSGVPMEFDPDAKGKDAVN